MPTPQLAYLLVLKHEREPRSTLPTSKSKTLDPGFRRDDRSQRDDGKISTVIPAQAGIQWRSLCRTRVSFCTSYF
jgi:hypothetical protein